MSESVRFNIVERERYPFAGAFLKVGVTKRDVRGWIGRLRESNSTG